jgi:uncharacterized protein (TIGR01777 family)
MKVVVSGASGQLGSALVPALRDAGHEVLRLVRRQARVADELSWDPAGHILDPDALADVDAVIHLAGAGVGDRRWTAAYKREIRDSRVNGTQTIAAALAAAKPRPRVLLSASGINWYGDTADRTVDESAPSGEGFLADLCREWEAATRPAEEAGVRVVRMRTAPVLAPEGGLLGRLVPIFRLGVGGKLASGKQYMSWISLRDYLGAIQFLLTAEDVRGPVNLCAPDPVTNAEFTRALGTVLRRPTVLPVPGFAVRIVAGELADEAALIGQRALPTVLLERGYEFQDIDLDATLRWALAERAS